MNWAVQQFQRHLSVKNTWTRPTDSLLLVAIAPLSHFYACTLAVAVAVIVVEMLISSVLFHNANG